MQREHQEQSLWLALWCPGGVCCSRYPLVRRKIMEFAQHASVPTSAPQKMVFTATSAPASVVGATCAQVTYAPSPSFGSTATAVSTSAPPPHVTLPARPAEHAWGMSGYPSPVSAASISPYAVGGPTRSMATRRDSEASFASAVSSASQHSTFGGEAEKGQAKGRSYNGAPRPPPSGSVPATPGRLSVADLAAPLTKEQLVKLLSEISAAFPGTYEFIRDSAGADPSLRKLFVRALAWETTDADLHEAFAVYGPIQEAVVIVDRNTGRSRGFGFVTFATLAGAQAALRSPSKIINGRTTSCSLASMGTAKSNATKSLAVATASAASALAKSTGDDTALRKLFVRGLAWSTTAETLRTVFGTYGAIEDATVAFDRATGQSRGFGFVTFSTVDGATRALQEPSKTIDDRTTHCNLAIQGVLNKQARLMGHRNAATLAALGLLDHNSPTRQRIVGAGVASISGEGAAADEPVAGLVNEMSHASISEHGSQGRPPVAHRGRGAPQVQAAQPPPPQHHHMVVTYPVGSHDSVVSNGGHARMGTPHAHSHRHAHAGPPPEHHASGTGYFPPYLPHAGGPPVGTHGPAIGGVTISHHQPFQQQQHHQHQHHQSQHGVTGHGSVGLGPGVVGAGGRSGQAPVWHAAPAPLR